MAQKLNKVSMDNREFVKELASLIWEAECVSGFEFLKQDDSSLWPNSILVIVYLRNKKMLKYIIPSIEMEMASTNKIVFASYIWDNILRKIENGETISEEIN